MIKGKITLSGKSGTGKTSVGNLLASKLGYELVSVGKFSREFAKSKYGMSIDEFQDKCKQEPELDKYIDREFEKQCNERTNLIIDWRLGFHFVKNAFKVYLTASDNICFERIRNRNENNENKDPESIQKKDNEIRERFIDLYGVDLTDTGHYDLIINTDNFSPELIVDKIISEYTKWSEQ